MSTVPDLARPRRYPRSSSYDLAWLLGLDLGPNPLWLLEDLLQRGAHRARGGGPDSALAMLEADRGEHLTFALVSARTAS